MLVAEIPFTAFTAFELILDAFEVAGQWRVPTRTLKFRVLESADPNELPEA